MPGCWCIVSEPWYPDAVTMVSPNAAAITTGACVAEHAGLYWIASHSRRHPAGTCTSAMLRYYLILAALLGAGILAGLILLRDPAPEQPAPDTGHSAPRPTAALSPFRPGNPEVLAALQQQLQQERQAREQLAAQVETLQQRLEEFESSYGSEVASITDTREPQPAHEPSAEVRTSVQSLIDAGIEAEQAAWIQARLDEIDLQQLYLKDRATREGWLNKPRYHRERRQHLNAVTGLREEIGDDAYDRMLYTLGRANRVVIRDTMLNSPAEQYGLQAGDRIIEYNGQRVFATNELNTLTSGGDGSSMILLRVQRDDAYHDIYLPRGPLGIRMSTARELP